MKNAAAVLLYSHSRFFNPPRPDLAKMARRHLIGLWGLASMGLGEWGLGAGVQAVCCGGVLRLHSVYTLQLVLAVPKSYCSVRVTPIYTAVTIPIPISPGSRWLDRGTGEHGPTCSGSGFRRLLPPPGPVHRPCAMRGRRTAVMVPPLCAVALPLAVTRIFLTS